MDNFDFKNNLTQQIFFVVVGAFFMGTAFYFTPLKHINLLEPKINDIAPQTFYELYKENQDKYVFIDVRSADAFKEFHADGSVNIPLHVLYDQRKNLPRRGKEIVLICSGGRASGVGYHYLEHHGFLNLRRIDGGIQAWSGAGLPIVFGDNDNLE